MSDFTPPTNLIPAEHARSTHINNLSAASAAAFAALPSNANLNAGTVNFAVDTGTANTYLVALPKTAVSYSDGLQVVMRPVNTNTGASSINVDSLGVKSIKTTSGEDAEAGDITEGSPILLIYSTDTGYFHISPNSAGAAASAAASATAAATSYDNFDDRYLGDKAADPTVDNDGNALLTGALYFNTTTTVMKVYNGASWQGSSIVTSVAAGTGIDVATAGGVATVSVDLKANGGLVIESTELAVDLGASSITGTLAVLDGGTGVAVKTGTGAVVLSTNPTLATPNIGVAIGTSFQGIIGNVTPAAGIFSELNGPIKTITQAATDTLSAAECSGTIISNYGQSGANTQTLPAAAVGLNGIVVIGTDGTGAFHLKAGPSDKIYFDGTALDDGDKVSLATPAVGNYFTFFAFQTGAATYDWIVETGRGSLSDGGP